MYAVYTGLHVVIVCLWVVHASSLERHTSTVTLRTWGRTCSGSVWWSHLLWGVYDTYLFVTYGKVFYHNHVFQYVKTYLHQICTVVYCEKKITCSLTDDAVSPGFKFVLCFVIFVTTLHVYTWGKVSSFVVYIIHRLHTSSRVQASPVFFYYGLCIGGSFQIHVRYIILLTVHYSVCNCVM